MTESGRIDEYTEIFYLVRPDLMLITMMKMTVTILDHDHHGDDDGDDT